MNRFISVLIVLILSSVFPGVVAAETSPVFDAGRAARLSIHKTKSTSDTGTEPLPGVVFRINKIEGINLSNNDDWGSIAGIDAREIQNQPDKLGPALEVGTTFTDSGNATAVFNNLPLGVYLVTEQPTRIGDVSYSVTAPFLVALPMNMGEGWEYDVVVWAKNQPISITKTASVDKVMSGEEFTYQLSGTVPVPDHRGRLYRYVIKDELPQGVEYQRMSVRVASNNAPELQESKDYTVEYDTQRHEAIAQLTQSGLDALAKLRLEDTGVKVLADIHVKVRGKAGEKLDNTAVLYPDGYNPDNSGGITSNKHRLDIVGMPDNDGGGRNKDTEKTGKIPPAVNTTGTIAASESSGDGNSVEGGASKDNDGVLRLGKLAFTGAGIYGICIAGAIALFAGAALIYYRDKKQRNAKL